MTQKRTIRILISVLFLGLLAAPMVIQRWSSSDTASADAEDALQRHGFAMEEVAADVGLNFTHQKPTVDDTLSHIMPEIASMGGASVAVVDYNNDGHDDLYVTSSARGSANALFENQGDDTFTDVAPQMGLANVNTAETGVSMGSVWADYDNDGYPDLFLYKWGRPELYHNDQGEGFTRVSDQAGLPDWINANTAIWFDYNRDGRLDLFVGGFYREALNLWDLETTKVMPESFEYANNGGRNYLFRNDGNGQFTEVAEEMGLTSTRWTLAAVASDLNGTGYPDLFVANDYGVDELYLNEQGTSFTAAGEASNVGFTPKSGMNASLGDVLNRGQQAIYVSNISESGYLMQGNSLWMPRDSSGTLRYQDLATGMGVSQAGWSYGGQFGDLNNDGWLDLFVVNGYVSDEDRDSYWYDFSKVAGGHKNIIADAANWPAMEGRSLSGYQRTRVWINDGAGSFQNVASAVGVESNRDGRAVAFADFWDDGSLDVIVANQGGPLEVYRNTVPDSTHWMAFELTGTASNRSAIGAMVELHWDDHRQVQTLTAGSGYSAQNQRRLYFGLGADPSVDKAVIRWPSGRTQTIASPALDTVHRITEPATTPS
jgi:hypothetical protein